MSTVDATIDLALIGGTGVYDWPGLVEVNEQASDTPWGRPSSAIRIGQWQNLRLAFLSRHGTGHRIAPHEVNYRANLWALHQLGVRRVIGINAVGGITGQFAPACLALPDQIIDYTWGRAGTYHDSRTAVPHAEFAEPYSQALRQAVLQAAGSTEVVLIDSGCYGATQGPRLETRAEIARMRRDGCDVVGMTGMPEAALARELDLDYCCLAIVANWAAGCGDGAPITMAEVSANVEQGAAHLPELIGALAGSLA